MAILKNLVMAGKDISTSFGKISFNENGEAEVSDEVGTKLSSLNGYSIVSEEKGDKPTVEEKKVESEPIKAVEEDTEKEAEPEVEEKVDLEKMNVPQLKKYAKEHKVDLGDAKTKVDIIAILEK